MEAGKTYLQFGVGVSREESKDFGAAGGVFLEDAAEGAGDHGTAGFSDAADGHAGVYGFDDAGGADGVEFFHESVGDLGGEAFLNLWPAGVAVDEAGEFAQTDDFPIGKIGNMGPAGEGKEVMFAEGMELDIAKEDDFVVSFAEYCL